MPRPAAPADPRAAGLPLRLRTPDRWADEVLRDGEALLNDHAHLERKAASNALDLLHRWPDAEPPDAWISRMTAVARDEVEHLATVTRLLDRRGGTLTKSHRNPYANDLRDLVRLGSGPRELMDRLMVCALIEARSCERFEILARACATEDTELARLYRGLWASEHGHYLVFLDLGRQVLGDAADEIERRWSEMLDLEAEILQAQPPGPRMHSWPADG